MDRHQKEVCSQEIGDKAPGSPSFLTQSFAAICLDGNRDEQKPVFPEATAVVPTHLTPTTPEKRSNTTATTTKAAGKDIFDVLPPEIIDHILSFLPISTLYECTVLSQRWSKRVLPRLWHAPFMIYYVSWIKLLQHLSTCPLPLRERAEKAIGGCSSNAGFNIKQNSDIHGSEVPPTIYSLLPSPSLSPNQSNTPFARRRLSSQFTSSSCSSSTTSYLYRFPVLDKLSTSPPTHQIFCNYLSCSHSACSSALHHYPIGRRRCRRPSFVDTEQQEQVLAAILGGVPRYAHYIRILDFSQLHYIVSDRLLTSLIPHTPFLTELILDAPKQLSDDSLFSMAASSAMLCHHLRRLELHHCRRITDRGLSAIIQHCTHLDTIRLSGGTPVNDRVVNMIAHLLSPTLRRVDFSYAMLVTGSDPGLKSLAIWCQRELVTTTPAWVDPILATSPPTTLPEILPPPPPTATAAGLVDCRFSGCQGITDALIGLLANLEVLHVAHCHELTDQAMMSVASRSPGLVELDITACWAITDRGIWAVGRGCQQLKRLILEEAYSKEETQNEVNEGHPGCSPQQMPLGHRLGSPISPPGQGTSTMRSFHSRYDSVAAAATGNVNPSNPPNSSGHNDAPSSPLHGFPTRQRISKDALRAFAWGDQVLQRRAVTHGWRCARIF